MEKESETIEVVIGRRRILFAGSVARMEGTRLPKCAMFGELVRSGGYMGEQEKKRKTAEQGTGRLMATLISAEKVSAGLWLVVVSPNVTGRTKERIAQSKRARAGSFAVAD